MSLWDDTGKILSAPRSSMITTTACAKMLTKEQRFVVMFAAMLHFFVSGLKNPKELQLSATLTMHMFLVVAQNWRSLDLKYSPKI